jgi:hypothetical protein
MMRVTRIEVSYRLTESAEFNNVQVERRVTMEYPTEPTDGDPIVIDSMTGADWESRMLATGLRAECERDVDAWLEEHGQSPRYYRGPLYVAWRSRRGVLVILPVGEVPAVDLGWAPFSPDSGMRLSALRRLARRWVGARRDLWLMCLRPANVAAFLEDLARRLEPTGDPMGEADADADAWHEDVEDDGEPF